MSIRIPAPIIQLAQRYPYCTACLALSALLLAGAIYLHSDLGEFMKLQQDRGRDGDQMLKFIAHGPQLRAAYASVHAASQRITESLIVEKNIPENFWYFYKIEQETQTKLLELQQRPAVIPDSGAAPFFKRVPYSLRIAGPYRNLLAYLRQLELGSHFARINSFALQRQDASGDKLVLQLDLELLAFP